VLYFLAIVIQLKSAYLHPFLDVKGHYIIRASNDNHDSRIAREYFGIDEPVRWTEADSGWERLTDQMK
jgi:hypothetical protein